MVPYGSARARGAILTDTNFPNCCSFGKIACLDTYVHGSLGNLELVVYAILVEDSNLVTYLAFVATNIPPSSVSAPFPVPLLLVVLPLLHRGLLSQGRVL